jgi:putative ABC transport system permease protein
MYFFQLIRIAFEQLKANRLRSILTTLGIVIGIGTVILIVSVHCPRRKSLHEPAE